VIFEIPINLLKVVNDLLKPAYKIGFLVACGYFKATKKFFNPKEYHQRDIEYVARVLGTTS
jgi:hypothetical protein